MGDFWGVRDRSWGVRGLSFKRFKVCTLHSFKRFNVYTLHSFNCLKGGEGEEEEEEEEEEELPTED